MDNSGVVGRIERPGQVEGTITVDMPTRTVVIEQRQTAFSITPDTVRMPFDTVKVLAAQIILAEAGGTVQPQQAVTV
jgi:hypothetical protein